MSTISRDFSAWVAGLHFDALPVEVVEQAQTLTLQGLVSVLLGRNTAEGRQALALIAAEDAEIANGATVLVTGRRFTRTGAAYANSEMMFAGGKWDTYQQLTHPGCAILPAALAAAETSNCSGTHFLTAVVAGYEVVTRLARDFVPTIMARGFHAGPVLGLFGAAVAVAKIRGFSEEQIHATITQCVNLAAGNLEGARSGGRGVREGAAVRNAMFAAALGEQGISGGDTVFEGPAGFFHSYAGDHRGQLTYSFAGAHNADMAAITDRLGRDWRILDMLVRIYPTAGYNNPTIFVTSALCQEHDIRPDDVSSVTIETNWLETQYPTPAFPSERTDLQPGPERPHYYAAHAILTRNFPLTKYVARKWGPADPEGLEDMMQKIRVIPVYTQRLFAPCVTVVTKSGATHSRTANGREMILSFDRLSVWLGDVREQAGLTEMGYQNLVQQVSRLARADGVSDLVAACQLPVSTDQ